MNKPTPVEMTPQQQKAWDETRTALIWHCPAFTHILYSMMDTVNQKTVALFTKDIPVAATDGSALMLNPDTFFKYDLGERVFIVAHEIMHCILNHMGIMQRARQTGKVSYPDGKSLPYEHMLMNVAMDLVINDLLIECRTDSGQPIFKFNKEWLHDKNIATKDDSVLDAYRKIYKKAEKNGKGKGGAQDSGVSGQGFDEHLAPGTSQGTDPSQAMQDRNEVAWGTAVAAAANAARVQGKLPSALDRMLSEVLDPKVDWREKIEALFARKIGTGTYNWKSPDRRLIVRDIVAPGRSGFGADTIVVAIDTSGSIGNDELKMFFGEMAGILEDLRPRRLLVVWCDAKVHRVDEIDEPSDLYGLRKKGAPGGGGTSFIPVFDWMAGEEIQPEALVYLTDGYGSFPAGQPSYPVIWGNISKPGSVNYPFGDVVDIPASTA